jgi:hypothetical protein
MSDRWGVDLADDNSFQRFFGGSDNRGFHFLLEAGLRGSPEHIRDLVNLVSADNLIYVHGNTCESDIGLTRTLAHEPQHFLQCSNYRKLWAIEGLFQKPVPNPDLKANWETPSEVEARIVAKKVTNACFTREQVDNCIPERIEQATSLNDRGNWRFVQSLDPMVEYDFVKRDRGAAQTLQAPGLK